MTTNQTIDGVPRYSHGKMCMVEDDHGEWLNISELRALLNAPDDPASSLNRAWQAGYDTGYYAKNPAHERRAVQPQGEPVAWANWKVGSKSYIPYRTVDEARRCVNASEISATQNGPYRVVPLYAKQPAPVAVAPEGWQMVPVAPTDDMIVAFAEAWYSKHQTIDDPDMLDAYRDMLVAAPQHPQNL